MEWKANRAISWLWVDKGSSASRSERHGKEADNSLPNIKMGGAVPPLEDMTSQCVQGQIYLYTGTSNKCF